MANLASGTLRASLFTAGCPATHLHRRCLLGILILQLLFHLFDLLSSNGTSQDKSAIVTPQCVKLALCDQLKRELRRAGKACAVKQWVVKRLSWIDSTVKKRRLTLVDNLVSKRQQDCVTAAA